MLFCLIVVVTFGAVLIMGVHALDLRGSVSIEGIFTILARNEGHLDLFSMSF